MTIRSFALHGVRPARYLLALTLLGALTPSDSLAGQEPGDFVRVSGNLTAEFIRSDSTGLYLSSGFVPYSDITSLELLVGTRVLEGLWKGVAIGAGAGLGLSLVACLGVWITEEPSDNPQEWTASSVCGLTLVTVVPIAALGGGVVGTVVGLATNRFTPIPLPTAGLGMSGSAAVPLGLTLGVRLRF